MALRVYNTMTRRKEDFVPLIPGEVKMYVCGVTVYDMCHIGHARSMVLFDVIYRYLLYKNFAVTYVRNFTDVDDKIINRAKERREHWKKLAEKYIDEFYIDVDALGCLRPTQEPRATDHIPQIQELIARLIEKGHAYVVDGDVMFSVEKFKGYGKLSGKRIEDLEAGARVEVDEKKRNPLDFALWKAAKPDEPFWDSPWGPGRPGWHIECSAMSMHILGEHLDIHGGGADLTFPHHENEIAQSESVAGAPFAKYWIHNGFVNIRQEKMSKSLGNVLNIRDILKQIHPEVLRLFLLSSHYRSPLDYNDTSIKDAETGLRRLYSSLAALDKVDGQASEKSLPTTLLNIRDKFCEAMDDDFNTPKCLALLFDMARAINKIAALAPTDTKHTPHKSVCDQIRSEILDVSRQVLGILKEDPKAFVEDIRKAGADELAIDEHTIQKLIDERTLARKNRDFKRADEIRAELASHGIVLEDGPAGTTWKVKESR